MGGIISLILGSLMLIESPAQYLRISLSVILPFVLVSAGFFLFALTMVIKAQRRKPITGKEGLIGQRGKALTDIMPQGKVELLGEIWEAYSEEMIPKGETVEVVGVEGLKVKVKRKEGE
jgi:membrane-bound serine protease (ClpP class)